MKRIVGIGMAAVFAAMAGPALAAPAVSPGALRNTADRAERSIEEQRQNAGYYRQSRYRKEQQASPLAVESLPEEKEQDNLSFTVTEIRVTPSSFFTPEEIKKAVHFPGPGKMTLRQLQQMVDRLNALYREKKILTAQAVLPPQTVKNGVVLIRLIEGKIGEKTLSGNHRVMAETVLGSIRGNKGDLVNLPLLEQDLQRYNSSHAYKLSATVVPGAEEGTSDVELRLEEPDNPWTSFLFTDNTGQKESGRLRIGGYAEYRGIGGTDAALAIAPVWSDGVWGGSVLYDTPVGSWGTRASFSYSRNLVDIVDGEFKDFDIKAQSNDLSVGLTQALTATRLAKVDAFLEGHKKWSETTYSGMQLSDRDTRTIRGGISARKFDDHGLWFGMVSVTGYRGKNKVTSPAAENNGSYYNAYLMRRQDLPLDQYLLLRVFGQYTAFKDLPSTEQFTLGGMGTVRGFDEGVIYADKGWFAGMEYGFPISRDHRTWRGFIFLDHGAGYNNYDSKTTRNFLSSTGLGLEYAQNGWYGKVVLGIPVNHSEEIRDQHPRVHFYLQRNL